MTKSGIKTSEFWATAASQLLTLLALTGLIGTGDLATLQDAVGKCVAAAALFATNAWVVVRYIQSRTHLKQSLPPPH
jgi:hypothetical protein